MTLLARLALPEDAAAIRAVHASAFPTKAEADLVAALDTTGDSLISVVAVDDGVVVAHALFSRMHVDETPAVALAPVATRADRQRLGFASAAIVNGLDRCRACGEGLVLVLGDPAYYRRFGFTEAPAGIVSPWPAPHFMALPLIPDGLIGVAGRVRYSRAFEILD